MRAGRAFGVAILGLLLERGEPREHERNSLLLRNGELRLSGPVRLADLHRCGEAKGVRTGDGKKVGARLLQPRRQQSVTEADRELHSHRHP
jgi:hypothetical protein